MTYAHQQHRMSIRQACVLFALAMSVYYYNPSPRNDATVHQELKDMAENNAGWGFWMMYYHLRNKGKPWNHKRIYRVYTAMGLNMRRKYKKRPPGPPTESLAQPLCPNLTWSMDFMHDTLSNGVKFRTLNIIDDYNREGLSISNGTSMPGKRVVRELNRLIQWRDKPEYIRMDQGPEFVSKELADWAKANSVTLLFTPKGQPYRNGYVERFNRSFREEVLSRYLFDNLRQVTAISNAWLWSYNNERPHSSLEYETPVSFLLKRGNAHMPDGKAFAFATLQKDKDLNKNFLLLSAPI